MVVSYDEIRRIHRLEKNTSQLVELSPDFYSELQSFISGEKKVYLDSLKNFSVAETRDFTNMKKMIEEIFSMREKKLLAKALIASRTKEISFSHMATQEKELFTKIVALLGSHNSVTEGLFSGNENSVQARDVSLLHVKIVSDVPSFVGGDMKEWGPFQKNEEVELPVRVARLLTERKLAVIE